MRARLQPGVAQMWPMGLIPGVAPVRAAEPSGAGSAGRCCPEEAGWANGVADLGRSSSSALASRRCAGRKSLALGIFM
eukprot:1859774-Heterocapsa_arctica.AAC.1